jgi:hypothetical protein
MSNSGVKPPVRVWGLVTRRERWGFSARGWLAALLFSILSAYGIVHSVHPFLAVTHPLNTKALVMEGWLHEWGARAAAAEFSNRSYDHIYVTGGPVSGAYTSVYDTFANVGRDNLKAAGVPDEVVRVIPAYESGRDRTYSDAIALRGWFAQHNLPVTRINIVTEGAHARRTRLLFQKAFGKRAEVGIIAVPNPRYDAKHWWRYSEGVREVVGETIAYVYARVFFHPSASGPSHQPPPRGENPVGQ